MVEIYINGKKFIVSKKKLLIDIIKSKNIHIPTLCYEKNLSEYSGCRLCLIEIKNKKKIVTSCSTYPEQGMVIETDSKKIIFARKKILELIVSNHKADCLSCYKSGSCKLQYYCFKYNVKQTYNKVYKNYRIDDNNPFIIRDKNKCILCGKCVRICQEVQVTNAINFNDRGYKTNIGCFLNLDINKYDCRFCGQCIEVCPTGALINKQFYNMKIKEKEVKKIKTTCPFCGVGCNFDLNVKNNKIIGVTGNKNSIVNGNSICVKGRYHTDMLNSEKRITYPMIKINNKWEKTSYKYAINYIVKNLKKILLKYGRESIAGLSSARCTNEDNYIFQKFFRTVLKNNNIDHCART